MYSLAFLGTMRHNLSMIRNKSAVPTTGEHDEHSQQPQQSTPLEAQGEGGEEEGGGHARALGTANWAAIASTVTGSKG